MFNRLYNDVRAYDDYFILKKDAIVNIGFSGDQKYMTAKDACLWHGRRFVGRVPLMSESTCHKAMVRFATTMVKVFGSQYLREQTVVDAERLMTLWEARWWPGRLGSLDCM